MVQLNTKKTALVLYGVLLVLPTAVLAGLQWYQLERDHTEQLERGPRDVADAARRLSAEIEASVTELLEAEAARPFYVYRDRYFPVGTLGTEIAFVPSPLTQDTPEGVLAWVAHDASESNTHPPRVMAGTRELEPDWIDTEAGLRASLLGMLDHDFREGYLVGLTRFTQWQAEELPATIAAINLHPDGDINCLREEVAALQELSSETIAVNVSSFHLRFYREGDGTPRVAAMRHVKIEPNRRLWEVPTCVDSLGRGATLVQGFFIDPNWFFRDLPLAAARAVLDPDQLFVPPGSDAPAPEAQLEAVAIRPVELLRCETYRDEDLAFGEMEVALNTGDLEHRLRRQMWRYLAVTGMLLVSLTTGMVLLLRSVHRDLEQAQRTENFVAAVTHELRTPLAAIKLYGEMLMDGWVQQKSKQEEYYRRIVRETGRLETMVERVLEKGRVTSDEAPPAPGDLSTACKNTRATLEQLGDGKNDVVFELSEGLPDVLLIPEGVRSILTNLVENARKYAPVNTEDPNAEPILVRARLLRSKVVLEVLDRGPGIPQTERKRIFDAFYRVGNEATRTSSGTGLGLHLVALQMRAMRGRIQVLVAPTLAVARARKQTLDQPRPSIGRLIFEELARFVRRRRQAGQVIKRSPQQRRLVRRGRGSRSRLATTAPDERRQPDGRPRAARRPPPADTPKGRLRDSAESSRPPSFRRWWTSATPSAVRSLSQRFRNVAPLGLLVRPGRPAVDPAANLGQLPLTEPVVLLRRHL